MRLALATALIAALTTPALAQTPQRPQGQRPPAQRQQAQPPTAPAPPPGFFPCRTAEEVCYVGVVSGPSHVALLFTNDPKVEAIDPKPVELSSAEAPGTPLDLARSLGRVVMVTGTFAPGTGITKAEVVDTASPLVSFLMKQGGDEGPPQRAGGKPPPRR
jgi:hypothetical protein